MKKALEKLLQSGVRDKAFLDRLASRGCAVTAGSLLLAIERDDIALTRYLIAHGAPVSANAYTSFGGAWPLAISPLGRSVGRPEIMEALLAAGATFCAGTSFPLYCRLLRERRTREIDLLRNSPRTARWWWEPPLQRYIARLGKWHPRRPMA
jgi:hypothetical protein